MPDGLPPHDLSAERAVLGAALQYREALNTLLVCGLDATDFFREEHGWIWDACLRSMEETGYADHITVCAELLRAGLLDSFGSGLGGAEYVADLVGEVYTHIGVEAHAEIVMETARQRRIIQAASDIAKQAYSHQPPAAVIQHGMATLGGLLAATDSGMVRLGDLAEVDAIGPEWGVPALDRLTMGLVPGRLSLLAAPSGMGKSMLAAHVARHVAENGGRVAIFTMEMSNNEYQERMAHAISGVKKRYSRHSDPLTEVERQRLQAARQTIGGWDIHAYDRSASAERVAATVRLLALEKPVALVVVDYLHLMDMPDQRETSAQNLKNITKSLKQLAASSGCHVLLLSQMNRAALGEMRGKEGQKLVCLVSGEKYPQPFKEGLMGGAVENDADLVIQLQRHFDCGQNHIEVVVTKNRHGIEGHGMMLEDFAVCRFITLTGAEIDHIAAGNQTTWRALMRDQGLMKGE